MEKLTVYNGNKIILSQKTDLFNLDINLTIKDDSTVLVPIGDTIYQITSIQHPSLHKEEIEKIQETYCAEQWTKIKYRTDGEILITYKKYKAPNHVNEKSHFKDITFSYRKLMRIDSTELFYQSSSEIIQNYNTELKKIIIKDTFYGIRPKFSLLGDILTFCYKEEEQTTILQYDIKQRSFLSTKHTTNVIHKLSDNGYLSIEKYIPEYISGESIKIDRISLFSLITNDTLERRYYLANNGKIKNYDNIIVVKDCGKIKLYEHDKKDFMDRACTSVITGNPMIDIDDRIIYQNHNKDKDLLNIYTFDKVNYFVIIYYYAEKVVINILDSTYTNVISSNTVIIKRFKPLYVENERVFGYTYEENKTILYAIYLRKIIF